MELSVVSHVLYRRWSVVQCNICRCPRRYLESEILIRRQLSEGGWPIMTNPYRTRTRIIPYHERVGLSHLIQVPSPAIVSLNGSETRYVRPHRRRLFPGSIQSIQYPRSGTGNGQDVPLGCDTLLPAVRRRCLSRHRSDWTTIRYRYRHHLRVDMGISEVVSSCRNTSQLVRSRDNGLLAPVPSILEPE